MKDISRFDKIFARTLVAFAGAVLDSRDVANFVGAVSFDDDERGETVGAFNGPSGAVGEIEITGDAPHTVTADELGFLIFHRKGAVTIDRDFIFSPPADASKSYVRIMRVSTTGGGKQILTIRSGDTLVVPSGVCLEIEVTPDGVYPANTATSAASDPAPDPLTITPSSGTKDGGTDVTITGSGFANAFEARVGGAPITSFVVVNDTTITGTTAAHAVGFVDVNVTALSGTGSLVDGYDYTERTIDPHWLFEVDFSLLSRGGHAAATFLTETAAQTTNLGLDFARATGGTVQTGPSTVVSGLAADAARIGASGANAGLIIEPPRINGINSGGVSYARNIRAGSYASPVTPHFFWPDLGHDSDPKNQSQAGTQTANTIAGPDGQVLADTLGVVGGQKYSDGVHNLGETGAWSTVGGFNNVGLTFSAWVKATGTQHLSWLGRYPWDQGGGPGSGPWTSVIENVWSGAGVWERKKVSRTGGTSRPVYVLNDGVDRSADEGSAIGGVSSSAYVDLLQLEVDSWMGEVILAGDGLCAADRLSYAHGSDLADTGRLRLYFAFYPKHASTEQVSSSQNIAVQGAQTAFTLFSSVISGNRIFGEIIQGGADSYKLRFNANEAPSTFLKTAETMSWSADDFVELFIEAGAGAATKVKYRKNGGSWIVFTDLAALTTVAPTGTVRFFWNGSDDTATPAWRVKEIRAYDASGAP